MVWQDLLALGRVLAQVLSTANELAKNGARLKRDDSNVLAEVRSL